VTDIEFLSNDFPENWLADVANHLKNIGCTAHPDSQMRDSVKRFADGRSVVLVYFGTGSVVDFGTVAVAQDLAEPAI
jgi:hypothetical protein